MMLCSSIYKGPPYALLRRQWCFVTRSGDRCLWAKHEVCLRGIEGMRAWTLVPFGGLLTYKLSARSRWISELCSLGILWAWVAEHLECVCCFVWSHSI
jgi:hypothetical protein